MTVREYAKAVGFQIVGKLTRYPQGETYGVDNRKQRAFVDEAGNQYYASKSCYCIVTISGKII